METKHKTQDEIAAEWALIQQAQQNPALFAALYSKYFKSIFLFVMRRVSHEAIAEDLCTQVFSKALQNITHYKFKGVPFSAWLYRIALTELQTYYRHTKNARVVYFSASALELLGQNLQGEERTSLQEEREQLLMKALEHLNTEEMLYVEMRFFEDRSFKEIAEIQDITENNAKVKTYRIVQRLRKLILNKK